MATDLAKVDPAWAWAPFEPTADRPWSRRLAGHLYRRAGFGATSDELNVSAKLDPATAVDLLCSPPPAPADYDQTVDMLGQHAMAGGNAQQLPAWWLYRMLATPDPLLEKLTL